MEKLLGVFVLVVLNLIVYMFLNKIAIDKYYRYLSIAILGCGFLYFILNDVRYLRIYFSSVFLIIAYYFFVFFVNNVQKMISENKYISPYNLFEILTKKVFYFAFTIAQIISISKL